jgi:hypothetical protein
MAVNVGNPQDLTGRKKAQLEAELAEQRKEAASRMAMVTAQAEAAKDEVIDLVGSEAPAEDGKTVSVAEPTKKMRVNTTLENVTIGHGTNYNFEIGQTYKVKESVYDYLDELGFVWH